MAQSVPVAAGTFRIAIAGNPNAGKSSLFNCLTGLRQKVANYPGVTVERKVGRAKFGDVEIELLDLPGAYSLTAHSPDEQISRDVLFGWQPGEPTPDAVLVVIDATNLERNLFYATQIIELGYPTVLALNMSDLAEAAGVAINADALSEHLGVQVVRTVASRNEGIEQLRAALMSARASDARVGLTPVVQSAVDNLADELASEHAVPSSLAPAVALRLIASPSGEGEAGRRWGGEASGAVGVARDTLAATGALWQNAEAAPRYRWLRTLVAAVTTRNSSDRVSLTERIDRVLMHRIFGPAVFVLIMGLMFQSIFTWSKPFQDLISAGCQRLSTLARMNLPPGLFTDLVAGGILGGVGAVVVFIPPISFLFVFLSVLEDTGYMSRAAFVMDRVMSKVGLHGRSFVPLLSSFACAIPGIMAARTISARRDRLVTILIAPWMTCSARLPVYALLISAFVPRVRVYHGLFAAQGLALLTLYLLGIGGALTVAFVLKRTILRGPTPAMLLELPTYKWPQAGHLARDVGERVWLFLKKAGTLILAFSILLWYLANFPRVDTSRASDLAATQLQALNQPAEGAAYQAAVETQEARLQLEGSYLGHVGKVIEPLVRPLGFDWRIGVGLMSAFAAREVFVSTMGVIFAVGKEAGADSQDLKVRLQEARRTDGSRLFTPAVVWALLIYFAYSMQCLATFGVVVRETGGLKWPLFMTGYMTAVAYLMAFTVYHVMSAVGYG